MIFRAFLGLLIGLFSTLYVMQQDPWVHKKLETLMQRSLGETFDCKVNGSIKSFNLFSPNIKIKDFSMAARDGSWRWTAQQYESDFSWQELFKSGAIQLRLSMNKLDGDSLLQKNMPAIAPHINDLMKGPELPIPLYMTEATIRNAVIRLHDDSITSSFSWQCDAKRKGTVFRSQYKVFDGEISRNGIHLLSRVGGKMTVNAEQKVIKGPVQYGLRMQMRGELPQLGEYPLCGVDGEWGENGGRFQVESVDKSLRIHPLVFTKKKDDWHIRCTATMPIPFLQKIALGTASSLAEGSCSVQLKGSVLENGSLEGFFVTEDLFHPWFRDRFVCNGMFAKIGSDISGSINVKNGLHSTVQTGFELNLKSGISSFSGTNESQISFAQIPSWELKPFNTQYTILYDPTLQSYSLNYDCLLHNLKSQEEVRIAGTQQLSLDGLIEGKGSVGTYQYTLQGLSHYPFIKDMHVRLREAPIAHCKYQDADDSFTGSLQFSLLQQIAYLIWQHELAGEGSLNANGRMDEGGFSIALDLEDATIRLPQTYNFLSNASCELQYDPLRRVGKIKNLSASLHNGSLRCPEGSIWLDDSMSPLFAHVPLFIDRCLVSAKQDLFAVVTGQLLLSKKARKDAHLQGTIIINRAQLKENLFSEQLQKKLFTSTQREYKSLPLTCNVAIETKEPIKIDTPFLKANGVVSLHATGPINKPVVEGTITVPSGTIGFPYKPLEITKGEIHFVKEQPFNPLLEITAKNSIKNHHITLNVTGALQDNMVLLEATPPLTQEQIVGLLVAGAHEESLDALIPAILMKNVTNYIVSSHQSNFFERYIKPWMKQMSVRLRPQFGDQAGRGGLRGALEITLNDRWRALIEKNFTLTEDTHFELEYILSDDITFRMIRDERRDIGGEVEMKWKF